jgi:hypothetical protein
MKFHENQSSESPDIACGRTKRHDKLILAFSNCSVKAPKTFRKDARGSDRTVLEMWCKHLFKIDTPSKIRCLGFIPRFRKTVFQILFNS